MSAAFIDRAAELPGLPSRDEGWIASYLAQAGLDDVMRGDAGRGARWWHRLMAGMAQLADGRLADVQDRISRQANDIGTAFRLPGEADERRWPLSAIPLLIGADEWRGIEAGIVQRAELLELILDDVFGPQRLVADGAMPAAAIAGSARFWRSMIGIEPAGGRRLAIYAADLARGPDGEWRVLADHTRTPAGAGYALENRLASSRVLGPLQKRLNIHRLAPFFATFREGLAAISRRSDPRIALLTPGRFNQSYAEQAHLARYLGLLLVEGEDLAVREDRLFVRTIEGLKRIDVLWRRMDSRLIDPLSFDSQSQIGVPGLMDAVAAGNVALVNAPGAGVAEARVMAAFLPALSLRLLREPLAIPNIATWWCGQPAECAHVAANLDSLLIAPAFESGVAGFSDGAPVLGADLTSDARAALMQGLARRPQDYVGQEVVRLSTVPAVVGGMLAPRPFTLRVFAARDGNGGWRVMPGGFARLSDAADVRAAVMGDGAFSADVCIVGDRPSEAVSLLPRQAAIRRNPGTLPSRAADNLYWLGRYIERAEVTLRIARAMLGGTIDADSGAALMPATIGRLAGLLLSSGAVAGGLGEDVDALALAANALDGPGVASVRTLFGTVHAIGAGIRDRLSADVWRLLDAPLPVAGGEDVGGLLDRANAMQERFSALAGLATENMARTSAWRFQDLGRRVERAILVCRQLRIFAGDEALADDLTTLLDLADSQISYRARYMTGIALAPVRDLIALDPWNPRALAYQIRRIGEHLSALPVLGDDGMAEEQQLLATEISGLLALARAESLGTQAVLGIENRLLALSDAIGHRFFLHGSDTLRATGMTLA